MPARTLYFTPVDHALSSYHHYKQCYSGRCYVGRPIAPLFLQHLQLSYRTSSLQTLITMTCNTPSSFHALIHAKRPRQLQTSHWPLKRKHPPVNSSLYLSALDSLGLSPQMSHRAKRDAALLLQEILKQAMPHLRWVSFSLLSCSTFV